MSSPSSSLKGVRILVTGGNGFIGSHTVLELLERDAEVVVLDDLSNSHPEALKRVEEITGKTVTLHKVDIRDKEKVDEIISQYPSFYACIHFAALKAVGESVSIPLQYYDVNIRGVIGLLQVLEKHNIKRFIFSSSATVYGLAEHNPIPETAPLSALNPYGQTKLMTENILRDVHRAPLPKGAEPWKIIILRYFNPIGAHKSGKIGEDPNGIPNNLLPYVMQVAVGKRQELGVFGNDYPTADGTGVRDYIHVVDLARGHVVALEQGLLAGKMKSNCEEYNLGTGKGSSVLEVVAAAEKASGKKIPYKVLPRRPGDAATCFSDPTKVSIDLGWKAEFTLEDAVADSWRWQSNNPNGFQG